MVIPMSLLRTVFQSACLTVVMDTFFMGFQSEMFWGPSLRWESGRSWGTGCWSQTLHSPGKIWDCEFLPKCMFLCQGGGAYGDRVSQPFYSLMWVFVLFCFLICPVCGSHQLVSGFLSERISQCVGVDLVCLSEESSGASCVAIFHQNPWIRFVCL